MNYLELIRQFWKLDNAWQFTCCETRLYFYLVETANSLGWANSFIHGDDKTSANVGVSKNTFKTARNRLSQAGLISFKEGGKGHANKTRYQILTPNLIPKVTPKPIPNPQPKVEPLLNKHKQNETDKSKSKDLPKAPTLSIEERKEKFYNDCAVYVGQYPKNMIRDFFDYWTEKNASGVKMRFEKQTTWELAKRLATWARKDNNFSSSTNKRTGAEETAMQIAQEIALRHGTK
jgi:hypothetical protein